MREHRRKRSSIHQTETSHWCSKIRGRKVHVVLSLSLCMCICDCMSLERVHYSLCFVAFCLFMFCPISPSLFLPGAATAWIWSLLDLVSSRGLPRWAGWSELCAGAPWICPQSAWSEEIHWQFTCESVCCVFYLREGSLIMLLFCLHWFCLSLYLWWPSCVFTCLCFQHFMKGSGIDDRNPTCWFRIHTAADSFHGDTFHANLPAIQQRNYEVLTHLAIRQEEEEEEEEARIKDMQSKQGIHSGSADDDSDLRHDNGKNNIVTCTQIEQQFIKTKWLRTFSAATGFPISSSCAVAVDAVETRLSTLSACLDVQRICLWWRSIAGARSSSCLTCHHSTGLFLYLFLLLPASLCLFVCLHVSPCRSPAPSLFSHVCTPFLLFLLPGELLLLPVITLSSPQPLSSLIHSPSCLLVACFCRFLSSHHSVLLITFSCGLNSCRSSCSFTHSLSPSVLLTFTSWIKALCLHVAPPSHFPSSALFHLRFPCLSLFPFMIPACKPAVGRFDRYLGCLVQNCLLILVFCRFPWFLIWQKMTREWREK